MASSEPEDRSVDLRRRRAEVSKQAIRDAVAELLRHEHPATLSVPAVAERAGVSVRTVYRYFPTKQELLDDVAFVQTRRTEELMGDSEAMFESPGDYLRTLWSDFERNVDSIRAQHRSPAGAELRQRREQHFRGSVRKRLDERHPETSEADREGLTDLIMVIMSSSTFLDMHDRLGRSGADAARLAWWAARAVQKEFAAAGGIDPNRSDSRRNEVSRADSIKED